MRDRRVDRQKVIDGLQGVFRCVSPVSYTCGDCPYQDNHVGCKRRVLSDAIALLKALDVTPEELERLKMCRAECKIDCLLEHYNKVKDELEAMKKAQEPQDDDADFMTHIICEICDYAVKNEMEPNDTLLTIADNIKALLKISTFNNWKVMHHG